MHKLFPCVWSWLVRTPETTSLYIFLFSTIQSVHWRYMDKSAPSKTYCNQTWLNVFPHLIIFKYICKSNFNFMGFSVILNREAMSIGSPHARSGCRGHYCERDGLSLLKIRGFCMLKSQVKSTLEVCMEHLGKFIRWLIWNTYTVVKSWSCQASSIPRCILNLCL